jgi:hypothetical protein
MWNIKTVGKIEEGDPRFAEAFVEGRVEIREHSGRLIMCFKDTKVVARPKIGSDGQQQTAALFCPKLMVFLSEKKPKQRMTDIHLTGVHVPLLDGSDVFGRGKSIGTFRVGLKGMMSVDPFRGVVITKVPTDLPITQEAVVYGFAKLVPPRSEMTSMKQALGLTATLDMMHLLEHRAQAARDMKKLKKDKADGAGARAILKAQQDVKALRSGSLYAKLQAGKKQSSKSVSNLSPTTGTQIEDEVQLNDEDDAIVAGKLAHARRLSERAWGLMRKDHSSVITYKRTVQ